MMTVELSKEEGRRWKGGGISRVQVGRFVLYGGGMGINPELRFPG
jgi:hypothetical protein